MKVMVLLINNGYSVYKLEENEQLSTHYKSELKSMLFRFTLKKELVE